MRCYLRPWGMHEYKVSCALQHNINWALSCKIACPTIALLLVTTLICGTLALAACSALCANCVASTAHAIFAADNATGATFFEAAKALQLSNHLEVLSVASLCSPLRDRSSPCIGSVAPLCPRVSVCFLCALGWGY